MEGVSHTYVQDVVLQQTENLPSAAKAAADHATDFEPRSLIEVVGDDDESGSVANGRY